MTLKAGSSLGIFFDLHPSSEKMPSSKKPKQTCRNFTLKELAEVLFMFSILPEDWNDSNHFPIFEIRLSQISFTASEP
jgi:hypothetical protein